MKWLFKKKPADHPKEFYDKTVDIVTGHIYKLGITDQRDLEDLVQDTYVEAISKIHTLKDPQAGLAWILTIARRQVAKFFEAKNKSRFVTIEDQFIETLIVQEESTTNKDLIKKLTDLIANESPEAKRNALFMFLVGEYALKEISEETGVKVSTLTTWINRFRKKLKVELSDYGSQKEEAKIIPFQKQKLAGEGL